MSSLTDQAIKVPTVPCQWRGSSEPGKPITSKFHVPSLLGSRFTDGEMEATSYILGSGPLRSPRLLRPDLTFLPSLGSLLAK